MVRRDERGRIVKGSDPLFIGGGRKPLCASLTEALRNIAEPDKLAKRLLKLSQSEDENIALASTKYIWDRLEGRPKESMDLNANISITTEMRMEMIRQVVTGEQHGNSPTGA